MMLQPMCHMEKERVWGRDVRPSSKGAQELAQDTCFQELDKGSSIYVSSSSILISSLVQRIKSVSPQATAYCHAPLPLHRTHLNAPVIIQAASIDQY